MEGLIRSCIYTKRVRPEPFSMSTDSEKLPLLLVDLRDETSERKAKEVSKFKIQLPSVIKMLFSNVILKYE